MNRVGRRITPLLLLLLLAAPALGQGGLIYHNDTGEPDRSPVERAGGGAVNVGSSTSTPIGMAASAAMVRPTVIWATAHDRSPALRAINPIPPAAGASTFPVWRRALGKATSGAARDPVVQSQPAAPKMPAPIQSFAGLGNVDQTLPPDTNGDVGPDHYVQWVNVSFAIWRKNGVRVYGPAAGNTLWSGFGGACEISNDGDPIALYDHLAGRWLLSQFANPNFPNGPFYQCVAISQTSDPTGAYYRYAFQISATKLNDYPKFGVWPDGYYMSSNQYTAPSLNFGGAGAVVFERDKMLLGQPARMVYIDLGAAPATRAFSGMLPADLDGPPPPAGAPNYFVAVDDASVVGPSDALRIWRFHVDWADPASSTFGLDGLPNTILPTAPFDLLPCAITGSLNCIPQRGTTQKLDGIGDRLMYRLQYRNFGSRQTLTANHTVNAGAGRAGIRWYEVRDPGGAPVIHQQGTYAPADSDHRWMASAAMDGQGNLALGFSAAGSATYPAIRYAGRLSGDPAGVMAQGEATLQASGGAQTSPSARWGDYTTLAVDPADGCTFWYTNEYYPGTSDHNWQTRIGSFKFPTCSGASTGGLAGTVANSATGDPIAGATVTAGTSTATTSANGNYQLAGLTAGTYDVSASAPGFISQTAHDVMVSGGLTTTQDFALSPIATPTPTATPIPPTNSSLFLPLAANPPLPTPIACGEREPNDDAASATPLNTAGRACIGAFPGDDQKDWYAVDLAAAQTINVSLTNIPADDNYDIYLLDVTGRAILASSTRPGDADDSLTFTVGSRGRYYVVVYAWSKLSTTHTYVLTVRIR